MSSMSLPTSTRMLRVEPSTPVQSAELSASISTNSMDSEAPLSDIDVERAIVASLRASGLSESEACRLMKVDASQWSKQKKNVDNAHVSFQRLTKLPRQFWLALLQELAPALGIVVAHPDLADRAMSQLLLAAEAACTFARQDRALRAGGRR